MDFVYAKLVTIFNLDDWEQKGSLKTMLMKTDMKLLLKLRPLTHCFINLPATLANRLLTQPQIINNKTSNGRILIRLQWNKDNNSHDYQSVDEEIAGFEEEIIIAWSGDCSQSIHCCEISHLFARSLNLKVDTEVNVSLASQNSSIPDASLVIVEPATSEDWELLNLNANFLEDQLINQIATVRPQLIVPIWVNPSVFIQIKILSTQPTDFVKLVQGSEVVVTPKPRKDSTPIQDENNKDDQRHGDEKVEKPQRSKDHHGSLLSQIRVLRIQNYFFEHTVTNLLCNEEQIRYFGWEQGQLVDVLSMSKSNTMENGPISSSQTKYTPSKYQIPHLLMRVVSYENVQIDHIAVHHNAAIFLQVHLFSRLLVIPRLEPFESLHIQSSLSPIENVLIFPWYPPLSNPSEVPRLGPKNQLVDDSLQSIVNSLNEWKNKNAVFDSSRLVLSHSTSNSLKQELAIPITNGLLLTINQKYYRIYCNMSSNVHQAAEDDHLVDKKKKSRQDQVALESSFSNPINHSVWGSFGFPTPRANHHGSSISQLIGPAINQSSFLDPSDFIKSEKITSSKCPNSKVLDTRESIYAGDHLTTRLNYSTDEQYEKASISHQFTSIRDINYILASQFEFTLDLVSIGNSNLAESLPHDLIWPQDLFLPTATSPYSLAHHDSSPSQSYNTELKRYASIPIHSSQIWPILTLDDIGGLTDQMTQCLDHLGKILGNYLLKEHLGCYSSSALFIYGQHGSGKTLLTTALAHHFSTHPPYYAYPTYLNCLDYKSIMYGGDVTMEKMLGSWMALFREAVVCQPSIIILDNLDSLLPSSDEQQTAFKTQDSMIYSQSILNEIINWFVRIAQEKHSIAIVITVKGRHTLHEELNRSKYIGSIVQCSLPDQSDRVDILKRLIKRKEICVTDDLVYTKVSAKCEGYTGADLEQLLEHSTHARSIKWLEDQVLGDQISQNSNRFNEVNNGHSLSQQAVYLEQQNRFIIDHGNPPNLQSSQSIMPISPSKHLGGQSESISPSYFPSLTNECLLEAVSEFVPMALKGLKLKPVTTVSWMDIGGLEELRQEICQTLEWPTKYSFLYDHLQIRQPSGFLLYGPSGCGKTMIACAIAKECGLNFLSVKGPELLNKYIGQSEQGVRDLFSRAQSIAPSVLFFDEFDSIAPRRGHDNTGVTDRIVNQFLTELDGIESLLGVYVCAATSRPDLIDPALLRPGRLDKAYYVGPPALEERISIFKAQSRKMKLSDDVDFGKLAAETENYTGADLQALLYNAQLLSIYEYLNQIRPLKNIDSILRPSGATIPPFNMELDNLNLNLEQDEAIMDLKDHTSSSKQQNTNNPVVPRDRNRIKLHRETLKQEDLTKIDDLLFPTSAQFVDKNLKLIVPGASTDKYKKIESKFEVILNKLQAELESSLGEGKIDNDAHSAGTIEHDYESSQVALPITCIFMKHLKRALEDLEPSIKPSERLKNEIRYANFDKSQDGVFSNSLNTLLNQKISLA